MSQDTVKSLAAEIAALNELVYAPGAWHCEKCGFVLQKTFLNATTGDVTANTQPFNEQCPNDGQLMRPTTWKQMSEANYEAGAAALQREQALGQWKKEMLEYCKRWDAVDDFVRKHPEAPLGRDVSTVTRSWLCDRDFLKEMMVWLLTPGNSFGVVDINSIKGQYTRICDQSIIVAEMQRK